MSFKRSELYNYFYSRRKLVKEIVINESYNHSEYKLQHINNIITEQQRKINV